jgi:deoxycytidine triphosphate deaminase
MAEVEEMLGTRVSYVGVGPTLDSTLEIPIAAHLGISNITVIRGRDGQERSGFRYSVGGKDQKLKLGDELRIPPFEVAVIEILETVNMPRFLIGRWNIRVAWAYEGLIWVGGPQVDAGFRGILLCPIWNLSNKDFFIKSGEPIAVIDFQTTTPPTEGSKPYEWRERSRIVFQDYDKPRSGLVTDLIERIEDIKKESEQNRSRIDFFIATTFGALGILVAALAFIATRSPDNVHPHWWDPALYWLYSITTFLALMAWMKSRSKGRWWRAIKLFVLLVAAGAICLQAFFSWQQVRRGSDVQGQIQQLKTRIDSLEHPQD